MTQQPEKLRPFMDAQFTRAKRALGLSERLGIAIPLLAVGAVFIPDNMAAAAWVVGILSVACLVIQNWQVYRFRDLNARAEEVRRTFLLRDGLGGTVSQVELSRLRRRYGKLEPDKEPYYTSHLDPGPRRLLMLVWESAFWSEDLQEHLAREFWLKAARTTGLTAFAFAFALYGPEVLIVSRVLPPALALLVGANLWGKWWDSKQVQQACREVCADCRGRVMSWTSEGEPGIGDVMQVVLSYSATMLTAYPAPDKLYQARRGALNEEWDLVVRELADTDRVETGE
jgi:hypothetical protein